VNCDIILKYLKVAVYLLFWRIIAVYFLFWRIIVLILTIIRHLHFDSYHLGNSTNRCQGKLMMVKLQEVKKNRALNETPSQSYGMSLATWMSDLVYKEIGHS